MPAVSADSVFGFLTGVRGSRGSRVKVFRGSGFMGLSGFGRCI